MKKYEVISPEFEIYPAQPYADTPEPAEFDGCYVVVEADNKKQARWLAVKTKEFDKWRQYAADCEKIPVSGLEVNQIYSHESLIDTLTDMIEDAKVNYQFISDKTDYGVSRLQSMDSRRKQIAQVSTTSFVFGRLSGLREILTLLESFDYE